MNSIPRQALFAVFLFAIGLSTTATEIDPQVASVQGLQARFVDIDGINTRFYDEGSGDTLLLVHGGPWEGTSSANDWSLNIKGLAREFRVLAPDRLGNGMTDNPGRAREVDFSIAGQIGHMARFIEVMDIGPVNVVAHGTGGSALFLAVERPDLVKSLILVSSNLAAPAVGKDRISEVTSECPWQVNGDEIGPWMDQLECLYRVFSYDDSHLDEEHIEALRVLNLQPKVQWTRFYRDGGAGEPFRSNFSNWRNDMHAKIRDAGALTIPVLLVWSRNDPTHPQERSMALYDILGEHNPSVQTLIMNRVGHFPFREKPNEFNYAVVRFVSAWKAIGEIE
jgi:2-hydroxy-6-oxo-6-(2'-carboxyphenyl)-hexa-2,4-dienoate hydrolase